jgi:restriction system protein
MAIPDFQSLMLPLLRVAADGREHSMREAIEQLASKFHLTDDERRQLLPSGQQPTFDNRVHWARAYLKAALLIESPRRGYFKIMARGSDVLKNPPERIDIGFLSQFEEFREFRARRGTQGEPPSPANQVEGDAAPKDKETPEELVEEAYQDIREGLAAELLQQVKDCSPAFFERLVVDLLVKMGYGGTRRDAGEAIGRSGDGGIDGIIKEDRLGLDIVYVQAKRWEAQVGRPEIQKFAGALQGQRARKGVFITTSTFSRDAEEYARAIDTKIILIAGARLAQLMIDFDIGVTPFASYELKRVDADYFAE